MPVSVNQIKNTKELEPAEPIAAVGRPMGAAARSAPAAAVRRPCCPCTPPLPPLHSAPGAAACRGLSTTLLQAAAADPAHDAADPAPLFREGEGRRARDYISRALQFDLPSHEGIAQARKVNRFRLCQSIDLIITIKKKI